MYDDVSVIALSLFVFDADIQWRDVGADELYRRRSSSLRSFLMLRAWRRDAMACRQKWLWQGFCHW